MASSLGRAALRRVLASGVSASRGSQSRSVTSSLRMPAMSPTMTEGGIAGWKKQEGESFVAGDVLLEIETDKATIDVEAQDDGIMGKIIKPDGSKGVPVGQIIAVLAEEGDDLGSIEIPKEDGKVETSGSVSGNAGGKDDTGSPSSSKSDGDGGSKPKDSAKSDNSEKTFSGSPVAAEHHEVNPSPSSSTSSSSQASSSSSSSESAGYGNSGTNANPEHVKGGPSGVEQNVAGGEKQGHGQVGGSGRVLFLSVSRLLTESNLPADKIASIKGTGRNGMLTKGDVLFALGKIKNARGSAGKMKPETIGQAAKGATATTNAASAAPATPAKPLTGAELRRLVLDGMGKASRPAKPLSAIGSAVDLSSSPSVSAAHDFDDVLAPYASLFARARLPQVELPSVDLLIEEKSETRKPGGAVKDEWEGLF